VQSDAPKRRAVYDDVAQHYESVMGPFERWFLPGMRQRVFENLPKSGRILEVGAGTGLNFTFYPEAVSGAATELSGEMLKIARSKRRPESVRLVQSAAEQLPFANGSFDAGFATLVMCSVESPYEALAELRRVVKPGGTVVLLDHVRPRNALGPLFDLLNLITSRLFSDHVNRRMADIAESAGFEITKREQRALGIISLIVCTV
jgi:phosphatidylethanolamine/phosphatidyl-N-methylethanolamine N-methyltransferase